MYTEIFNGTYTIQVGGNLALPPLIAFLLFLNERDLRTFDFFFLCSFVYFLNVLDMRIMCYIYV